MRAFRVFASCDKFMILYESAYFLVSAPPSQHNIRNASKTWNRETQNLDFEGNPEAVQQLLINSFHCLRIAALMMHPFVPLGCEKIREQLALGEHFWSWDHAFEPVYFFMDDPTTHQPKHLEPRQDFFERHPSQFN